MRKPIHIVFSFITLFAFTGVLFAQPQNAVAGIDAVMKQYDVPGLSVAVVKNGKLAYTHAFGFKDREKQIPLSEILFGYQYNAIGTTKKTIAE